MRGASSPSDVTTVLELYKIAVEMADRVSARRGTTNAFFLTAQATFVAVLGIFGPNLIKVTWWVSLTVALSGILLSLSWWLQLHSYRRLNRAKFAIISEMEDGLPVKVFSREWMYLKGKMDGVKGRYLELGGGERVIPWVFAVLHALLFIERLRG